MATAHIDAEPGDFAPAVLMPGNPRRAWLIAETPCDSPRLGQAAGGARHAPSFHLLSAAVRAAKTANLPLHVGPVFSSDHLYATRPETTAALLPRGTLAVEMESAALYATASAEGGEALTLPTVTDHLGRSDHMSAKGREGCLGHMSRVAIAAGLS